MGAGRSNSASAPPLYAALCRGRPAQCPSVRPILDGAKGFSLARSSFASHRTAVIKSRLGVDHAVPKPPAASHLPARPRTKINLSSSGSITYGRAASLAAPKRSLVHFICAAAQHRRALRHHAILRESSPPPPPLTSHKSPCSFYPPPPSRRPSLTWYTLLSWSLETGAVPWTRTRARTGWALAPRLELPCTRAVENLE